MLLMVTKLPRQFHMEPAAAARGAAVLERKCERCYHWGCVWDSLGVLAF